MRHFGGGPDRSFLAQRASLRHRAGSRRVRRVTGAALPTGPSRP